VVALVLVGVVASLELGEVDALELEDVIALRARAIEIEMAEPAGFAVLVAGRVFEEVVESEDEPVAEIESTAEDAELHKESVVMLIVVVVVVVVVAIEKVRTELVTTKIVVAAVAVDNLDESVKEVVYAASDPDKRVVLEKEVVE